MASILLASEEANRITNRITSTRERAELSDSAAPSTTIFIAEDNPILLQGLERALTANGYAVQTAPDGLEMIDLLRSSPLPDILLVDVMMPGMSGLEVLDTVRKEPRTAHLPVVLITAAAEELVPGSGLVGREVDVLMKPFRLSELLSRIETHVGDGRTSVHPRRVNAKPPSIPAGG